MYFEVDDGWHVEMGDDYFKCVASDVRGVRM